MAGGVEAVQIVGLKQFQADLRQLDKSLPAELRKLNLAVAQMVVEHAQARAASLGAMQAKAATVLKAQAQQRNAAVSLTPTSSVPFALGAEFGAGRDSPRQRSSGTYVGYRQFEHWGGNGGDAGYFMYPTIRADDEHIVDAYVQRLNVLLAKAFPN